MVGVVKFFIFKLTYSTQFWSYEHVTNMFLVCFAVLKHLQRILERFEQQKIIFGLAKTTLWR